MIVFYFILVLVVAVVNAVVKYVNCVFVVVDAFAIKIVFVIVFVNVVVVVLLSMFC